MTKVVLCIYLLLTLYSFVLCMDTAWPFFSMILAVSFMWLVYFFFYLGTLKHKNYGLKRKAYNSNQAFEIESCFFYKQKKISILLILLLMSAFSILSIRFYTGSSILEIFRNIVSGVSNYNNYQEYVRKMDLGSSLIRVPFALMLGCQYLVMVFSGIEFTMLPPGTVNRSRPALVFFFTTLLVCLFSLARGTTFEFFILLVFFVFLVVLKYGMTPRTILIGVLCFITVSIILMTNTAIRGNVLSVSLSIDRLEIISNPFFFRSNVFGLMLSTVFGYLGYGIYYLSCYLEFFFCRSIEELVSFLFPFIHTIFWGSSLPECNIIAEKGVKWSPDIARLIDSIGVFGLFLYSFVLGSLSKLKSDTVPKCALKFIVLMQCISFPIGGFVGTSSSLKIVFVISAFFVLFKITPRGITIKNAKIFRATS